MRIQMHKTQAYHYTVVTGLDHLAITAHRVVVNNSEARFFDAENNLIHIFNGCVSVSRGEKVPDKEPTKEELAERVVQLTEKLASAAVQIQQLQDNVGESSLMIQQHVRGFRKIIDIVNNSNFGNRGRCLDAIAYIASKSL